MILAMRHLQALSARWRFLVEPYEVLLAFGALFVGPVVLFGLAAPTSLARQVSPWMLRGWGAGLFFGAVFTLAGRWFMARARAEPAQESAARLEVLGLTIFTGAGTMYALSVLAVGALGIPAGLFIGAFAGASAIRIRIITNEWRGHRQARRPRGRRRPRDG